MPIEETSPSVAGRRTRLALTQLPGRRTWLARTELAGWVHADQTWCDALFQLLDIQGKFFHALFLIVLFLSRPRVILQGSAWHVSAPIFGVDPTSWSP